MLDDLIRHAQVLGMQDFTRSDALATAEYRNDFKQYKWARCMCSAVAPLSVDIILDPHPATSATTLPLCSLGYILLHCVARHIA